MNRHYQDLRGLRGPGMRRLRQIVSPERGQASAAAGLLRVSLLDQGAPPRGAARRGGPRPPTLLVSATAPAAGPLAPQEPEGEPDESGSNPTARSRTARQRPARHPADVHVLAHQPASPDEPIPPTFTEARYVAEALWLGRPASTALPTSPVRVPRRASPGGHSFKFRAGAKPARVAGPAYGPLNMPDPRPGRPPAKAAPAGRDVTCTTHQLTRTTRSAEPHAARSSPTRQVQSGVGISPSLGTTTIPVPSAPGS
jgi:hypothetical protein